MKYNFNQLAKRKNTNCVKYDSFDVDLPMWVADMDFVIAPKIKEAITKDLEIGAIGYSTVPDEYFDAFVSLYHKRYNTNFKEEEMVYVSGVVAAIDSIFKTLCKEGDQVIMISPIYHTFYHCIENNHLEVITSQLDFVDGQFEINFQDLEKKLAHDKAKIFLLCNPHNPVGKIFNQDELIKISELAKKHHVLIISDEIHGLLTNPDKKYIPYSNIASDDNYVTCLATSKAFNLAGLQSAVIVCPNKERRALLQAAFYKDDIGEPNFFAVNANIAALRDSEDWLDEVNEYVYQNKLYFVNYLKDNIPELNPILTDATYMLWVDISKVSNNSREFCDGLKEKVGLLVSPGHQFGNGGETYFRINLATSLDNVKSACERLKKYIKG